ncbi:RNA polymerase sigma factor [Streptomyces sp. NPDC056600]|uniref:RNA polymerase sigma factor n=1 Tax=Streptomyces sp. NPDC056600 TaxID=3345874 RepID=UPI0036BDDEE1
MSSRPETPTRTTGAHPAHGEECDRTVPSAADARASAPRIPARRADASFPEGCEPHLDGLYTYSLSVLCDQDAAACAVGAVLAVAERRGGRAPEGDDRRAWLYALARWACLRELAEKRRRRHQHRHRGSRRGAVPVAETPAVEPSPEERERRRSELARLAWPEAAGASAEQREALELAVRHGLAAEEVATVLGLAPAAAQDLLASAACEVERTRAAVGAAESGRCPGVVRLTGQDDGWVLSEALRTELVRHVDDCPRCRRAAERAVPGRWPGTSVTPERLPVLRAPRAAVQAAAQTARGRRGAAGAPRFDRRGFPLAPPDHEARRHRIRGRAVTTTVVATVVVAPVLAMWAAGRGAPTGVEEGFGSPEDRAATAADTGPDDIGATDDGGYANTANAVPGSGAATPERGPDVSVEVIGSPPPGGPGGGAGVGGAADGLRVAAFGAGDVTYVTLTAPERGGREAASVRWRMSTGVSWLYLSRSSGVLRPGESVTVRVHVDALREPAGAWRATVGVEPGGAVIVIRGAGAGAMSPGPGPGPGPGEPGPGRPPQEPPPSSPGPTSPPPVDPDPTPSPSDPSTPPPSPSGPPSGDPSPGDTSAPPSSAPVPSDQAPTAPPSTG